MAVEVMTWVFNHSRSKNGERLLMLAIADACNNPDGSGAWLSNAALCAKTNLSERAVQVAVNRCRDLGELAIERNAGRGGVNRFYVLMGKKVQNLRGAESAGGRTDESSQASSTKGADTAGQTEGGKGAESAPGTVSTKNSSTKSSKTRARKPKIADADRPDVIEISNHLADMIERLGSNRPDFLNNKTWLKDARLLLDQKRQIPVDVDRVKRAIDWVEADNFWFQVVESMSALRRNWDKIRLAATAKAKREKEIEERNKNGRFAGGMQAESNAPKSIPRSEKCPRHPSFKTGFCGPCKSEQKGSRATVGLTPRGSTK